MTPGAQTVVAGGTATLTVTIGALNGFNGPVNLNASGLPAGASISFSPASVTGSGSVTATVATSGATPSGTSTLTVTATSGSLSHTATVPLTVKVNQPPSVSAGSAQTVNLPAAAQLSGTAIDDGLPNGTLAYSWTLSSGPGTVDLRQRQVSVHHSHFLPGRHLRSCFNRERRLSYEQRSMHGHGPEYSHHLAHTGVNHADGGADPAVHIHCGGILE